MTIQMMAALAVSAGFAAFGQVMLKIGATGRVGLVELCNQHIFAGLALYAMGVLSPKEVPDTFLLREPELLDWQFNRYRARKVPVRIQDIIAAMGERTPDHRSSQREFTVGVYLLHRGDEPDARAVDRTNAIMKELADYFTLATGGQIKLVRRAD